MTHKLVKFIRMLGLGLLMMGSACLSAKKITIHTLEAAIESVAPKYSSANNNADIIEFFITDPGNSEILSLLEKPMGNMKYIDKLYNITTWPEWDEIKAWFQRVTPTAETLSAFIVLMNQSNVVHHLQEVIDLVENDRTLTAKIEAGLYRLYAQANPNQQKIIQSWYAPQSYTVETITKYINFCSISGIRCDTQEIIAALQQDLALFNILKKDEAVLNYLYHYSDQTQREALVELVKKSYEAESGHKLRLSIIQFLLLHNVISMPYWAYQTPVINTDGWKNPHQTQSKPHFFENSASTLYLLKNASQDMRNALVAIYKKEQAERRKGNYVFYHAQRWDLHYSADIYKQFWNIAHKDNVGDDFTFFRFQQHKTATDNRQHYLFMNHALFGNSRRSGSCTVQYFMENSSIYNATFNAQHFFGTFNIAQYYAQYAAEFAQLERLHQQASSTGNLMLISFTPDQLQHTRPVHPGGNPRDVTINGAAIRDTKTILDTLISNPKSITDSDDIEYTVPLTASFSLNPKIGPRVYSFNAADPAKLKAHEAARDALFTKIKRDLRGKI